jgi:hypothetical protein
VAGNADNNGGKGASDVDPRVRRALYNRDAATGTDSAAYCYGVWIKHLTLLWASGMRAVPHTVLELGPEPRSARGWQRY